MTNFESHSNRQQKLRKWIRDLNFFPSIPPTTDPYQLKTQRISTRLFIVTFISSLVILLLYTSLATVTEVATVPTPTLDQYNDLYDKYSETLSCPCSQISIPNKQLMTINYTLHQVCSSSFISNDWIDQYEQFSLNSQYFFFDFRYMITFTFESLATLCKLIRQTISSGLTRFYTGQYVTTDVTSMKVFETQMTVLFDQFKSSLVARFLSSLHIIRNITQANFLVTTLPLNGYLVASYSDMGYATYTMHIGACACAEQATCTIPAAIVGTYAQPLYFIDGVSIGCYMLEGLLQSSFKCFYDQACVQQVFTYFNPDYPINITLLNASAVSRFPINTTIGELLNEFMVERWTVLPEFANYFNECRPEKCTYIEKTKHNLIYIITTVIGLVGGLATALKLIIPVAVKLVRRKKTQKNARKDHTREAIRVLFKKYARKSLHFIWHLNFFPSIPPTTDPYQLKTQRISTRLFIVTFISSLVVLLLYTSLATVTEVATVPTPTLDQYNDLYDKYSETLSCPCSQISVSNERLMNVSYTIHQICSSSFVSPLWIEYLHEVSAQSNWDTQYISTFTFQTLASLCELASATIANSIVEFYNNQYVAAEVGTFKQFQAQTANLFDEFRLSTIADFLTSLRVIQDTTQSNFWLSLFQSNARLPFLNGTSDIILIPTGYGGCSCIQQSSCSAPAPVISYTDGSIIYVAPGIYAGCYMLEALLQSNFQCFYDQACIREFLTYLYSDYPINITLLNASAVSRFPINSTVGQLLDELMVEQWIMLPEFANYFNECRPEKCTYIEKTRHAPIYIITTVISLVGGLVTALKLIVPFVVKLVRRRKTQTSTERGTSGCSIRVLYSDYMPKLLWFIWHLNVFPSIPPTTDPYQLKTQRISTRLFIVTFISSLVILLLYTSLATVTEVATVPTPTLDQYNDLYDKYSGTLSCPCSQISIPNKQLMTINYTLHQVCSSSFVFNQWIDYLLYSREDDFLYRLDFRVIGTHIFQTLASLCELVNETIVNSVTEFYNNKYATMEVASFDVFQKQTDTLFDQFRLSTIADFLSSLRIVRDTSQINGLLSALETNGVLQLPADGQMVTVEFVSYNGCRCVNSPECVEPVSINNGITADPIFVVPGMFRGCQIIEALLQSNLACFYDEFCLKELMLHINSSLSVNVTRMNASAVSRFAVNNTVGELLDELLAEDWTMVPEFANYFNECRPVECTYSHETRNDFIYIVTALIGTIGGLITALKLIIPTLVHLIRYIYKKRTQINPQSVSVANKGQNHLQDIEVADVFY
ncbi:unnamed protein product [Adineta ricciae]|uniref:Uncharacterized protein n=1 Tax=Adineta ricciae TaxID=249248 RepID=A0A814T3F8_ADIRI|nr:unnamed protein product [Adineta ricciae]CAF1480494.1 unnamed protein product [Adineta ricciae]